MVENTDSLVMGVEGAEGSQLLGHWIRSEARWGGVCRN